MWVIVLSGIFLTGYGLYQLTASKDELWQRQEKGFRRQGIVNRQRTPEWERSQDLGGYFSLAIGIAMLLGGLFMGTAISSQQRQNASGERFYINGREISREEAARSGLPSAFR